MNDQILKIAQEILHLQTLQTANSGQKDFHEVAVWQVKQALEAAYKAGFVSGANFINHHTVNDDARKLLTILKEQGKDKAADAFVEMSKNLKYWEQLALKDRFKLLQEMESNESP